MDTQSVVIIGAKPYPRLGQAIGLSAILFLITILLAIVVLIVTWSSGVTEEVSQNLWLKLGSYIIPMAAVILLGTAKKRRSEQATKTLHFMPVKTTIFPVLFLLTLALLFITEAIANLIPMPEFVQNLFNSAFSMDIPTLLLIVFIAPVMEEFLFRGIFLDGFLQVYSPAKAIIWSAILFGVVHMNPWQFIAGFGAGLLLGWVYWKTRSLWPCIFIHVVNNGISYLIFYIMKDPNASSQEVINNNAAYYALVLGCLVIGFFLWKLLDRMILKANLQTLWPVQASSDQMPSSQSPVGNSPIQGPKQDGVE